MSKSLENQIQIMPIQTHQTELFGGSPQKLELQDADIRYWPDFLTPSQAGELYEKLAHETSWRQETICIFGKKHLTPRLSCWVADTGLDYSYSNLTMQPQPWSEPLLAVRRSIENYTDTEFNSVLLNYYRSGRDSNGWHADDEPELGLRPIIASLSLGAPRDFQLRHKSVRSLKHSICLQQGSLLLMAGTTQTYWQHQVPKRANAGPRINLTFRMIKIPSQRLK